jgi:ribonuclease J
MNIDRTVSVFKAARRAGRTLAIDLFSAEVLRSLADAGRIPQPDWGGIKVVVTAPLARRLVRMGREGLVDELIAARCAMSARALSRHPGRWVILSRSSLLRDYCRSGLEPTSDDAWVWSQWHGYKRRADWEAQSERLAPCARVDIHTSGHATGRLLQDFAIRLSPRRIIPVQVERR